MSSFRLFSSVVWKLSNTTCYFWGNPFFLFCLSENMQRSSADGSMWHTMIIKLPGGQMQLNGVVSMRVRRRNAILWSILDKYDFSQSRCAITDTYDISIVYVLTQTDAFADIRWFIFFGTEFYRLSKLWHYWWRCPIWSVLLVITDQHWLLLHLLTPSVIKIERTTRNSWLACSKFVKSFFLFWERKEVHVRRRREWKRKR